MNSVLIFAKAPLKGLVKTRLQKDTQLDESTVLVLYEAFLKDVVQATLYSRAERIYIAFYPRGKENLIASSISGAVNNETLGDRVILFAQDGRDFDERFTNAVQRVLVESEKVVVIGSDSPHIQPRTIDSALELLDKSDCMVLGPSNEGGVYLIGIRRQMDFEGVFTNGIESENLVSLAKKNGLSLYLLEWLTDIDVANDLIDFICNIPTMEYAASLNNFQLPKHTIKAIKGVGISVERGAGGERGKRIVKA